MRKNVLESILVGLALSLAACPTATGTPDGGSASGTASSTSSSGSSSSSTGGGSSCTDDSECLDSGVSSCGVYDGGNSDPRCSAASCTTMLGCGAVELPGMAQNVSQCSAIAGTGSVEAQLVQQCQEACQMYGNGEILACFAAVCVLPTNDTPTYICEDAGYSIPYSMCVTPCADALQTCDDTCSTTDAGACLDCGFKCAQQYVCCSNATCSQFL